MTDKYWCDEGCGFVDKDHRCEQWCNVVRIPGEAIEAIKLEKDEQIVDMISMIDGVYEVVELFGYRGSPAQKEWAKSWLARARSYGASPE